MAEIITVETTEDTEPDNTHSIQSEGPGARLAQARVALSLSQAQICERLKFTQSTLNLIETDNYIKDIPVTFYRGYIRAYAYVVKLDPEELIANFNRLTADFDDESPVPSKPLDTVTISHDERFRTRGVRSKFGLYLALTLLFFIAFGVTYWFIQKAGWFVATEAGGSTNSSVRIELPFVGGVPAMDEIESSAKTPYNSDRNASSRRLDSMREGEAGSAPDLASAIQKTELEASDDKLNDGEILPDPKVASATYLREEASNLTNGNSAAPAEPGVELTMNFTNDCWVKVTDYENEVMVLGLKKVGDEIAIKIIPPIRVTLGDPRAVSMSFNEKPVALSQYKAGRPVNFTLK